MGMINLEIKPLKTIINLAKVSSINVLTMQRGSKQREMTGKFTLYSFSFQKKIKETL